jgi:hypothetical protein
MTPEEKQELLEVLHIGAINYPEGCKDRLRIEALIEKLGGNMPVRNPFEIRSTIDFSDLQASAKRKAKATVAREKRLRAGTDFNKNILAQSKPVQEPK